MTELDMKILKRKLEVPWSYLTADEGHAIIAALEAAEELLNNLPPASYYDGWDFGPPRTRLRALLEGRDG